MAFKKGHKTNLGREYSDEHKIHLSLSHKGQHSSPETEFKKGKKQETGEKNPNWKGDGVGYLGLHRWIKRWKPTSGNCEMCGKSGLGGKKLHLANLDHRYRRVLDDYSYMCVSCHQLYDFKMGFRKK